MICELQLVPVRARDRAVAARAVEDGTWFTESVPLGMAVFGPSTGCALSL